MLGTVRFILAALVVLNHLWLPTANKVGANAVVAFYMISGYLMTKVIHQRYGLTWDGRIRFIANRALRLMPIYWACAVLTLVLLIVFGDRFSSYSTINIPDGSGLIQNLTLWDLGNAKTILAPPAWSLTIEWVFYFLIAASISRSKATTTVWFAASAAFTIYLVASGASFHDRYYPSTAASMFFSTGAMFYWYSEELKFLGAEKRLLFPLLALFCAAPMIFDAFGVDRLMIGFYLVSIMFVPLFFMADTKPSKTDKWLGDLAYPVFLTHFLCAGIVQLIFPNLTRLSAAYVFLSFLLSLVLSVLAVRIQSASIEPIRRKLWP